MNLTSWQWGAICIQAGLGLVYLGVRLIHKFEELDDPWDDKEFTAAGDVGEAGFILLAFGAGMILVGLVLLAGIA